MFDCKNESVFFFKNVQPKTYTYFEENPAKKNA